jgi:hypothetical protein
MNNLILLSVLLSGCAINTTTETITLDDGSKVCTWGQAGFFIPSMAGARDCSKGVITNYATSQTDIGTVAVQEAIRAGSFVGGVDLLSDGLKGSGDQIYNNATGGSLSNSLSNFNLNSNFNSLSVGK